MKCISGKCTHIYLFVHYVNIRRSSKRTLKALCGCCAAKKPILQRQEASLITNGSLKVMSNVKIVCPTCMTATDLLKYLSQASKLLNVPFWCHFFFSCLPLLLLTLFSIPRPQVSLIEMEPISPYTVFTHTRSSAVPFSLSPS